MSKSTSGSERDREGLIEKIADALDAGPFERGTWTSEEVAGIALDAAEENMVPATFRGLLTILDTWYPAEVFTDSAEDVGMRVVTLARQLALLEAKLAAGPFSKEQREALLHLIDTHKFTSCPHGSRAMCKHLKAAASVRDLIEQMGGGSEGG